MQLKFEEKIADKYKSLSQKIRVLTEYWVKNEIFCPSCGNNINEYENNRPVADFYCSFCKEEFELKSKKDNMGSKIIDGAYNSMIERLQSNDNPNLFLLNYNVNNYELLNFIVVPKHFFIPSLIEKRKALSSSARRAGWVGCNILIRNIPDSGRIFYIKDRKIIDKKIILNSWKKTLFLRESNKLELKGWILDVMNCIDRLNKKEFCLQEMYAFENILRKKYPNNKHIKDKIRQQLQYLRDKGYLQFIDKGRYRAA